MIVIRVRVIAATAVAALLVASCGSDDDGTAGDDATEVTEAPPDTSADGVTTDAPADTTADTTADTAATTDETDAGVDIPDDLPTQGVTDTEIKVGGVYTQAAYADYAVGVQARLDRLNAEGGVHGRQIVVTEWLDDGADPTTNADQVRKLVEQEGVFSVFAISQALSGGTYMAENNVPYFGWAISPDWCNELAFGHAGNTCPTEEAAMLASFATSMERALEGGTAEGRNVAIIGEDNDLAVRATEQMVTQWTDEGATVAAFNNLATPPTVVSDFAPFVLDVQESGADVVVIVASPGNTIGMISALTATGFEGDVFNFVTYDPRLAPLANGVFTMIQGVNPWEAADSVPAVQQMIDDVMATDSDVILSQPVAAGYAAADLMIAAFDAVGPDLTTSAFRQTTADFEYDFDGLAGPLSYPDNYTLSNGCSSVVVGNGEGYEIAAPLECLGLYPNPDFEG